MEREPWHKRLNALLGSLAGILGAVVAIIHYWEQLHDFACQKTAWCVTQPSASSPPAPPAPPQECLGLTSEDWRRLYLSRDPAAGTFHVYVSSLPTAKDKSVAEAAAAHMRKKFRNADFEPMYAQSATRNMWAVVIAQGINDLSRACEIAKFASRCGIEKDAYVFQMGGDRQESCN